MQFKYCCGLEYLCFQIIMAPFVVLRYLERLDKKWTGKMNLITSFKALK